MDGNYWLSQKVAGFKLIEIKKAVEHNRQVIAARQGQPGGLFKTNSFTEVETKPESNPESKKVHHNAGIRGI